MFAVVITGPPGAGKTSVLTALVDALSDEDIAHAAVEVEMLVWTHPALTDKQWARHLRIACELYREAGHRLLLVAQTLESDADVAELLDTVGADEVFLVRLEAEPASLVERIIEREPASWSGLSGLLEHAQELAGTMPGLADVDLVFEHRGRTRRGRGGAHPRGPAGLAVLSAGRVESDATHERSGSWRPARLAAGDEAALAAVADAGPARQATGTSQASASSSRLPKAGLSGR